MEACIKCDKTVETLTAINKCGHKICYECLSDHLDKMISAKVACPVQGCVQTIADGIIRKFLSPSQLKSYNTLCCSPNTVKCLIEGCDYLISHGDQKEGHFMCAICKQPNCHSCQRLHELDVHCQSVKHYNPKPFIAAAQRYLSEQRLRSFQSILEKCDLLANAESFVCEICCSFIPPKHGVSLRQCMHNFCRDCLNGFYGDAVHLDGLTCPQPDCSMKLSEREAEALVGHQKLQQMSLEVIRPKHFNCQTVDCSGMWDFASFKGNHICPVCKAVNCGKCRDIHMGQSCEQFRQSDRFRDVNNCKKRLINENNIQCHKCRTIIIKNEGCNAIRCRTCRLQVCAFSGKEIGPNGCKCKSSKPCHKDCKSGCLPEGNTPYETELRRYFNS